MTRLQYTKFIEVVIIDDIDIFTAIRVVLLSICLQDLKLWLLMLFLLLLLLFFNYLFNMLYRHNLTTLGLAKLVNIFNQVAA